MVDRPGQRERTGRQSKTKKKENDKEIRAELDELSKVKDIHMPTRKGDRNYMKEMTLTNARLWFRYCCKNIDQIKENKSSMYKDNMDCRLCTSGENETPKHLEKCEFTKDMRKNLDLKGRQDSIMEENNTSFKGNL